MLDLLKSIGELEVFTSDPDGGTDADDELILAVIQKEYDCYVFLQTEYVAERLRQLVSGRFVIIPMYDGARGRPDKFWRQFSSSQFISFCRTHHEHLESLGCRSVCFQFFPNPEVVTARDFATREAFFWERRPDTVLNRRLVIDLCRQLGVTSLQLHAAPDFQRHARTTLRGKTTQQGSMKVTETQWLERREDFDVVANASMFYFAPRLYEGIGMAALEAMSRGQIVVAPDLPTLNEYISHGATGILYDPARPEITLSLDPVDLKRMSIAARKKIELGRADWTLDIERMKSFLIDDGRRWKTRDVSSHFMNVLLRSASSRAFGAENRFELGNGDEH